jgi:hypothetical protein
MSSSAIERFSLVEGEEVLFKWEDRVRIDAPGAGFIRSKRLAGEKDREIPAYILITNKRLVVIAEYTTQRRLKVAFVISLPGGLKHEHGLYADFSAGAFQGVKSRLFGGAKLTFAPHGPLARRLPRANAFVVHCIGLKKEYVPVIEEMLTKAKNASTVDDAFGVLEAS